MALAPVQLDDLTWSQLATSARDRIAGSSRGEWTHHAPVDPGISLLELFAAQLEQRLYWLDQPSDERQRALLRLLDVRPKSAACAATVMSFPKPLANGGQLGCYFELRQSNVDQSLRFCTAEPVFLLDLSEQSRQPVRLFVGGIDRTIDLQTKRLPCLFSVANDARESRIEIDHRPVTTKNEKEISFLFDLETPDRILPEWHPLVTNDDDQRRARVAPAAIIRWEFQTKTSTSQIPDSDIRDGTLGFRRSGLVRLKVPHDVLSQTPLTIVMRVECGDFTYLPRVRQIVPNCVVAEHRVAQCLKNEESEALDRQLQLWKTLPGNTLRLPNFDPANLPLPDTMRLDLLERKPNPNANEERDRCHQWIATDELKTCGPSDRCFEVDRQTGIVRFGDGCHGRLPLPFLGQRQLRLSVTMGGGQRGNVRASTKKEWTGTSNSGSQEAIACNVVSAVGGEDEESVAQAVVRAAAELKHSRRTITKHDLEQLALHTPGVAVGRAHAMAGFHPLHPCIPVAGAVTVLIVPDLPDSLRHVEAPPCGEDLVALQADHGLLAAVAAYLAEHRLITQEIVVASPCYEEIDLQIRVEGISHDPDLVRDELVPTLRRFLHPLMGGESASGWPFGEAVQPSALIRVAQRSLPSGLQIQQVAISKRDKSDAGRTPFEACHATPIQAQGLVALRDVAIVFLSSVEHSRGLS